MKAADAARRRQLAQQRDHEAQLAQAGHAIACEQRRQQEERDKMIKERQAREVRAGRRGGGGHGRWQVGARGRPGGKGRARGREGQGEGKARGGGGPGGEGRPGGGEGRGGEEGKAGVWVFPHHAAVSPSERGHHADCAVLTVLHLRCLAAGGGCGPAALPGRPHELQQGPEAAVAEAKQATATTARWGQGLAQQVGRRG